MSVRSRAAAVCAMLLIAGFANQACAAGEEAMPSNEASIEVVARDANAFALDLYSRLAADDTGNLFFSPTSIATALALAHAGSRGETAEEMAAALHFSLTGDALHGAMGRLARGIASDRPGLQLTLANALWGQRGYPFREDYLTLAAERYDAPLREVDFRGATEQARVTINEWVASRTADKIRELLPPGSLDPLARLVLTNAVYFKGVWLRQFDPEQTREAPFYMTPEKTRSVEMMHARDSRFRYLETSELQALELPYSEHAASMIVLLPAAGHDLAVLESELTAEKLERWLAGMTEVKLDLVAIPRFRTTRRYSLPAVLSEMGMKRAFTEAADFSGIATVDKLHIADVVHEAFVEVNEEGTEAAAATGVTIGITSAAPGEPRIFRADHPFVFLIRDTKSGTMLFLGRVTSPGVTS